MIQHCPVCNSQSADSLLEFESAPVFERLRPGEKATEHHFAPLHIVQCGSCGHLYNTAFDTETEQRRPVPRRASFVAANSAEETRLKTVAQWIGPDQYSGKHVVEMSGGVNLLARVVGPSVDSIRVFDPIGALQIEATGHDNIKIINTEFSPSLVDEPVDLLICRHALEATADPMGTLRSMSAVLKEGGRIYLESPREEYIAETAAVYDLHNVQVQYFGRPHLLALAARAGLTVERQWHVNNGRDLGVMLQFNSSNDASETPFGSPLDPGLSGRLERRMDNARLFLSTLDGNIALYGANTHASAFLNLYQSDCNFSVALDDNPNYDGHALYSQNQVVPINIPTRETLSKTEVVVITAYLHEQMIIARLKELGFQGRIYRIEPEFGEIQWQPALSNYQDLVTAERPATNGKSAGSGTATIMEVRYSYLTTQFDPSSQLSQAILDDLAYELRRGGFTLGPWVGKFEEAFAEATQAKYAVGVSSGTDAIFLILKALNIGPGDTVLTAPNSFVASAGAVLQAGATVGFVDVGDDYLMDSTSLNAVINEMAPDRPAAILPVDLTGNPCCVALDNPDNIKMLYDSAQSIGSRVATARPYGDRAISLHPLKNVNVWGDGGVVLTDNQGLADEIRLLRNHGLTDRNTCMAAGYNHRLSSVQAIVGWHVLKDLEWITAQRNAVANLYDEGLRDCVGITIPPRPEAGTRQAFHTYVIQVERREELIKFLDSRGIETKIHYPVPIHLQPGYAHLGFKKGDFPVTERQAEHVLSLPNHQYLNHTEIDYVVDNVRNFFQGRD